eukprot:6375712-Prymnesium_polylepis.1
MESSDFWAVNAVAFTSVKPLSSAARSAASSSAITSTNARSSAPAAVRTACARSPSSSRSGIFSSACARFSARRSFLSARCRASM